MKSLAALDAPEVVAINNAAVLAPVGPVERSSPDEIARHLDVNVASSILFARAYVAAFQEHDCPKTFVNVSSGAASKGYAGWSLYCASKAALENYVRAVALEQAARPRPIRAISINPGVMDTAMQAAVRGSSIEDFPELERFLGLHREGRLSPPSLVAVTDREDREGASRAGWGLPGEQLASSCSVREGSRVGPAPPYQPSELASPLNGPTTFEVIQPP